MKKFSPNLPHQYFVVCKDTEGDLWSFFYTSGREDEIGVCLLKEDDLTNFGETFVTARRLFKTLRKKPADDEVWDTMQVRTITQEKLVLIPSTLAVHKIVTYVSKMRLDQLGVPSTTKKRKIPHVI